MVSEALASARQHHQAGRLQAAAQLYRQILAADPNHADAIHLLGVIAQQEGRYETSVEYIRRAIELRGNEASFHNNLGEAYRALRDYPNAIAVYRQALKLKPDYAVALDNLGHALRDQGRHADAADCYHRVLQMRPNYPEGHNNLGTSLSELGKLDEGMAHFQRALQLKPDYAEAFSNVGSTMHLRGKLSEAATYFQRALELNPDLRGVYESLGSVLLKQGRLAEAIVVWERWVRIAPDDPVARHLLAAATGRDVPARASDGYLQSHFDKFARTFDQQLERLGYRGPELVAAAVAKAIGQATPILDVLDAGCGTGAGGPLLRPYARRLTGVDLSSGMLELARARAIYDDLILDELTAHLRAHPETYDLIASADTLIYFGDLRPLLAAAAQALRAGGRLIVTAEQAVNHDPPTGGFILQHNGRYCHSLDYIRKTVAQVGLTVRAMTTAILRKELGHPVPGVTVSCSK